MDVIIVNSGAELEFTIRLPEKRALRVFFADVQIAPAIIWFYVLQINVVLMVDRITDLASGGSVP